MARILNHLLDGAEYIPSPNISGTMDPQYLVIHFTAGRSDAIATAKYFQNPAAKASAHLNLSEDGTWSQSVPFNTKAWHAGKSRWGGHVGLNHNSIGIEVCNPGPLTITKKGYRAWFGTYYDNEDIIEAPHPNDPHGPRYGWLPFTEAQNQQLIEVGSLLMEEYRLIEAVGHDMISPGRKVDPGPTMDDRIYDVLNNPRNDMSASSNWVWHVSGVTGKLNGRSGPSTSHEVLARLEAYTEVEIIRRNGVWWFVETENGKQVWVHSKFLSMKKVG